MKLKNIILILSIFMVFISCKKEEGFGGLATISGKVYGYDYNNSGVLMAEGYAPDIDVYIKAKNSSIELERIRTSYDGSFIFDQLRKGEYEVWVYSDCNSCPNGKEAVIQSVSIKDKKAHVELPAFEVNL